MKKFKFNKKQMLTWIDALYSGTYQQTKGYLQTKEGFCCLGVACDLFIPKDKRITSSGFLRGEMPADQLNAPDWLINITDDLELRAGIEGHIPTLNDRGINIDGVLERFTFEEIADLLYAVYILGVLDDEPKMDAA